MLLDMSYLFSIHAVLFVIQAYTGSYIQLRQIIRTSVTICQEHESYKLNEVYRTKLIAQHLICTTVCHA